MNQSTLRATLRGIDPDYKITKRPDDMSVIVLGRTIKIGSGNALAMLTKTELIARIERAGT